MDRIMTITTSIGEFHDYVRATGQITTQWFFFTCTINAAVAGWLIHTARADNARCLPCLFIVCNLTLVAMYAYFVPRYYDNVAASICKLSNEVPENARIKDAPFPMPIHEWKLTSYVLASACSAMGAYWAWFFLTPWGRSRVQLAIEGKSGVMKRPKAHSEDEGNREQKGDSG